MNLESIISITGKGGLFKVLSQTKNGLIVESIIDGKRLPVYASEKVSALNDISIYTNEGDMPLKEVYEKIYKKTAGKAAVDHKASPEELRNFLVEVVKDFDQERVYNSDLKKLFQWFNILVEKGLLVPEKKETKKEAAEGKDTTAKKAPAKKAVAKKPVVKKASPKTSGVKGGGKTATPSKKGK
jgi:transcriptional regulator